MRVWRLCRARHAATAFSGGGARIAGGRWNPKGIPIAYCASSLSLATLELFVHVDPATAPADLVAIEAELPDDSREVLDVAALPSDWRAIPAPDELKDIGAAWARGARSLALVVPSAVVPQEQNVLVNPAHVDLPLLRIVGVAAFSFDPRMWK
jgi:RES domain-containing protein